MSNLHPSKIRKALAAALAAGLTAVTAAMTAAAPVDWRVVAGAAFTAGVAVYWVKNEPQA